MKQVWDQVMENASRLTENEQRIVRVVKTKFEDSSIQRMLVKLLELEEAANKEANPLPAIRARLMQLVDTATLCEEIMNIEDPELRRKVRAAGANSDETDESTSAAYVAARFECIVLRLYSLIKYDDAGSDDWFTYYWESATEWSKSVVSAVRAKALGQDAGTADDPISVLSAVPWHHFMTQLRERLLTAPRKTAFRKGV